MEDIFQKIVEVHESGRFAVLATLIRLSGSAPRGTGTKCLILEDGSFEGTVGGGLLEARVLKVAEKVFTTQAPERLHFVLKGTDVAETEMLCGGDTEVFLEPLPPGSLSTLNLYKRAVKIQKQGGSAVMATLLDQKMWGKGDPPKMMVEPDGKRLGGSYALEDLEPALRERLPALLRKRLPGIQVFESRDGESVEAFLEPVLSEPGLYVFGGGHVSRQIVPLASRVGFRVVVVDDRPDFADTEHFPDASAVRCMPFQDAVDRLDIDKNAYLVVVTRGHLHDKNVLQQCLGTGAKYIGMIGSRRKIDIIYQKIREEGVGQDEIDRVHAPIGLEIGAETPEEIAVSIVAELIKVRAGLEEE